MNYSEALEFIHSVDWKGSRPGLERITELMKKLGDPQDSLRFIHVAGTNGKGSFCSMMSSVLVSAGYRVGLFTSPYVEEFNERIMLNGTPIPDEDLAYFTGLVKEATDTMEDKPTEFELITAIGMLYFKSVKCDIVVLEVGLGGRLDSTNIIKDPILSVITGIALDHTAILGDTVGKIAAEKAGIIKPGRPVLLGMAYDEADRADIESAVRKKAEETHSEVFTAERSALCIVSADLSGTVFDFEEHRSVKIKLLGTYQPQNAANVVKAVDILVSLGYNISEKQMRSGLLSAVWKARFEKICDAPVIFFDGSHNPQGINGAKNSIGLYFPDEKVLLLTGVLRDKDYTKIVGTLSGIVSEVFTVTPDNPRALSAAELARVYAEKGIKATPCADFASAEKLLFERAKETGKTAFVLGSLYIYGDVKRTLALIKADKKED